MTEPKKKELRNANWFKRLPDGVKQATLKGTARLVVALRRKGTTDTHGERLFSSVFIRVLPGLRFRAYELS